MKIKILLILAVMCTTAGQINAKGLGVWENQNRHSLSLGVGFYPAMWGYYTSQLGVMHTLEIEERNPDYDNYDSSTLRSTPAFSLNYFYRVSRLFSVGCTLGYGNETTDYTYEDTNNHAFTSSDNVILFTPTVRLHWLNTKRIEMYSGLGIIGYGAALSTNAERIEGNKVITEGMSTQLTPIALSIKLKHTYIFSELGIGTLGVFRLGVGHRF